MAEQIVEDYLNNLYPINSNKLRKLLISSGYKERKCECCGKDIWEGFPMPLQLHHIDGNTKNNNLDNLQVLCYNCHAITSNFRSKPRNTPPTLTLADYQRAIESSVNTRQACLVLKICAYGGNYSIIRDKMEKYGWKFRQKTKEEQDAIKERMKKLASFRNQSAPKKIRLAKKTIAENKSIKVKNRPTKEELLRLIWVNSTSYLAKQYNVTANAIKKWAITYNIPVPPVGYWRKMETGHIDECAHIKAELFAKYNLT